MYTPLLAYQNESKDPEKEQDLHYKKQ